MIEQGDGPHPPEPSGSGEQAPNTAVVAGDADELVSELRRQNDELEARNADLLRERQALERRPRRHRARTALAIIITVVGAIFVPLSAIAVWARGTVTSTDQYVATVKPLASDPAIQDAVATDVTNAIYARIDVPALIAQTLPPKAQVLNGPLSNAVKGFIHTTTTKVVTSQQFAQIWAEANRVAHTQLVGALEGKSSAGIAVSNGKVTVDLSQLVAQVKSQLSAAGLTVVDKIPTNAIHGTVTLFQSNSVSKIQTGFRLLNDLGFWMPIVAVVCLVSGVLLAGSRRRAIAWAAFGVLVAMVVATIAFVLVRTAYLDALPATVLRAAGESAFNIITRFLRQSAQALIALAAVVWIVAFVSGPARGAGTLRRGVTSGMGHLGDRAEGAGLLPMGARVFAARHRRWLQVGDVVLIVLILVLWSHPTAAVVLWMTLLGLFLLLVIEFFGERTAAVPVAPQAATLPPQGPPPPANGDGGDAGGDAVGAQGSTDQEGEPAGPEGGTPEPAGPALAAPGRADRQEAMPGGDA